MFIRLACGYLIGCVVCFLRVDEEGGVPVAYFWATAALFGREEEEMGYRRDRGGRGGGTAAESI